MSKLIGGITIATTSDYIYLPGGTLVATVQYIGNSGTTTRYSLPDNLNSTNVETDQYANMAQSLDCYLSLLKTPSAPETLVNCACWA